MTVFASPLSTPHRGSTTLYIAKYTNTTDNCVVGTIDGIVRCVCNLINTPYKWWIVPSDPADEPRCEDFGPYDTMEQAALQLKLLKS